MSWYIGEKKGPSGIVILHMLPSDVNVTSLFGLLHLNFVVLSMIGNDTEV